MLSSINKLSGAVAADINLVAMLVSVNTDIAKKNWSVVMLGKKDCCD
jgi:hypothetical protein